MTAYTSSNVASGQATYRSAPQGAAVTASTPAKSLSTSVSGKAVFKTSQKKSSKAAKTK
jgi:hypothetical protein